MVSSILSLKRLRSNDYSRLDRPASYCPATKVSTTEGWDAVRPDDISRHRRSARPIYGRSTPAQTWLTGLLLLAVVCMGACSQPPSTSPAPILLRMSGSTSMQPLLRELATAYTGRHPHVSFDLIAVGSSAGVEALRRGSADLALVSRELRPEEEYDVRTGERLLAYTVMAQDAIAVVVSADNPLRELTRYQIRDIFEGRIIAWDEVGGSPRDILVISREDGSGTRAAFEELLMGDHRMTLAALIMPNSEAMRDHVATHDEAIGYLSMGYLEPGVVALAIDGVTASRDAIEDGTYPLTRPFLLVSLPEPDPEVASFMDFARSPAGQAIVRRTYGGARAGVRP